MLSWGKSRFREAFLRLSLLRVIALSAKILALTATASMADVSEIREALHMGPDTRVISESPDR